MVLLLAYKFNLGLVFVMVLLLATLYGKENWLSPLPDLVGVSPQYVLFVYYKARLAHICVY